MKLGLHEIKLMRWNIKWGKSKNCHTLENFSFCQSCLNYARSHECVTISAIFGIFTISAIFGCLLEGIQIPPLENIKWWKCKTAIKLQYFQKVWEWVISLSPMGENIRVANFLSPCIRTLSLIISKLNIFDVVVVFVCLVFCLIPLSSAKVGSNLTYFQSKVRQSQNNDIYIYVFVYLRIFVFMFLSFYS